MKLHEKVAIQLALGLAMSASVWAVTAEPQGNPYQGVVERNVFALKPPPDPESVKPPPTPPPLIELQGIMSMFGTQKALFRTQGPAKPPKPAEKISMVLSVGQREGEIEVVAIDERTGSVTFNNHGEPQTLNLTNNSVKLAPGAAAVPIAGVGGFVPPAIPGVPPPASAFNPGQPAPGMVTTFSGASVKIPTRSLRMPGTAAGGLATPGVVAGSPSATAQAAQPKPLSPEEQIVHMEVLREMHKNNPDFPPLPPTELTPNPPSPPRPQ